MWGVVPYSRQRLRMRNRLEGSEEIFEIGIALN